MRGPFAGASISIFSALQIPRRHFVGQKTLIHQKGTFSSQGLIKGHSPCGCKSVIPHRGASGLQVRAMVSIRAWLVDGRGPLPGASGGRSPGVRGHGRAEVENRWIQWRRNDYQVGGGGQGRRHQKTTYPQIQISPRISAT